MTTGPIKSAAWRNRAEEYRQFADEAQSDDARRAYREVARNCEEIARRLEKLEVAEAARRPVRPNS